MYIYNTCIYIYILCAQSHARVHARRCSRMRAHTCLSHKYLYTYTYMYVYLQCMPTYIYKYRHTYTHMRITRLCYAQLCAHTWAPAHARAHTSARTRARAHRRCRRARRPTPHRRPRRARPACGGAPPGPERAAHTLSNVVTAAVFHAPMFALNAAAYMNACEPKPGRARPP